MEYIEGKIYTSVAGIEPVTSVLMEQGIMDAVVEDPSDVASLLSKEHEYDWDYIDKSVMELANQEPKVIFYLDNTPYGKEKLQQIKILMMMLKSKEMEGVFGSEADLGRLYVEDRLVDDSEWKDNWKEYFKPAKLTDRLVVKPTWEEYEAGEGELVIEIDPGMAFGTGTHPTTNLCLKFLEKYDPKGKAVLDVGCGSGILAIAAGLLGADTVAGVEIDPVAVAIGKENVELNGLSHKVVVMEGDLTKGVDFMADIVLANIMAEIVKLLSKDVAKHLKPGGIYISSGILTEKMDDVAAAIKDCGFKIIETSVEGEWGAIVAKAMQGEPK